MMKRILFSILGLLLLTASNMFADDVSIDSSGNVKTGVANTNAELEVTGASGEDGIMGSASGTGGAGMYGINTTYGNYGIVGDDNYGVFGYSPGGWAGYFQGNARVTGNLTIDGSILGPVIGDITGVTAGTGLSGGATGGDATLDADTTYLQRRVSSTCSAGSSISSINPDGTVVCETDDIGLVAESDPEIGSNTASYISKWDGSALVTGTIYDNGNVGIGTATPNEQLEITGNLRLPATTATTGIIKSGANRLIHTYGGTGFFAGINAGNLSMSGDFNTTIGAYTLSSNTTGDSNTASGYRALDSNTTGNRNTATGVYALQSNTTGNDNTVSGYHALYSNTTGSNNTASGNNALRSNTTGYENIASGFNALYSNTTGYHNTANGISALFSNTTGFNNTAIGSGADVSSGNLTNATAIGSTAEVNASNKVRIGNTSVQVIEGQVPWSWPSDIRIKKEIEDIGYGLEFVKQLRPVQYKLNEGNDRTDFGFIAQDIEALLGTGYNILSIGEDAERRLSLRYTDLIAPLVKAIQEQQAQIDELKAMIEELKKRN